MHERSPAMVKSEFSAKPSRNMNSPGPPRKSVSLSGTKNMEKAEYIESQQEKISPHNSVLIGGGDAVNTEMDTIGALGLTTGLNSSAATTMHQTSIPHQTVNGGNPLIKMIGGFGGVITSQAATLADFVQTGTQELAGSAMDRARSVGSTAKNIGEEVERRRNLIGKHVSAFTNQALSSLVPSNQKSISIQFPGWISDNELENLTDDLFQESSMTTPNHGNGYSRTISRLIGYEDDSISASNATQRLFFGLVHMYLLLLLIASFPAQWRTRTKIVISRKNETVSPNSGVSTDSENSDSDESGASSVGILDTDSLIPRKENHLKKSLSYVL